MASSEERSDNLYWLSEQAWATVDPLLPRGKPGRPRVDDRRVVSGIVHVLIAGYRWQDMPSAYGPYMTVYNRYLRWSRSGLWPRVLARIIATDGLPEHVERKPQSRTSRRR